jgi:hypothetical protein
VWAWRGSGTCWISTVHKVLVGTGRETVLAGRCHRPFHVTTPRRPLLTSAVNKSRPVAGPVTAPAWTVRPMSASHEFVPGWMDSRER